MSGRSKLSRRAHALNQRAKKLNSSGRVRKEDLILVLEHFGEECQHCGKELDFYKETDSPSNEATFDHILPLDIGGLNIADNIVPACRDCNQKRNRQHQLNKIKNSAKKKRTVENRSTSDF